MSNHYRQNWNPSPRKHIDARPPSPEKAAGMKWLHHGMDGSVIGGVTKEGIPFGTRVRQGAVNAPTTSAATGQKLADRQALHAEMVRAGRSGITPEMQARATALGVSGPSWLRTSASIQEAPGVTANNTVPPPGSTGPDNKPPASPPSPGKRLYHFVGPPGLRQSGQNTPVLNPGRTGLIVNAKGGTQPEESTLTPQIATNTPGDVPKAEAGNVRINRLTGKPFGYRPGDPEPKAPAPGGVPPPNSQQAGQNTPAPNPVRTGMQPNATAGTQPAKSTPTPQIATNTPGDVPKAEAGNVRINRLTGKPFGYRPGDPEPKAPAPGGGPSPSLRQAGQNTPATGTYGGLAKPTLPTTLPKYGGNPQSVALSNGSKPDWAAATMPAINPNLMPGQTQITRIGSASTLVSQPRTTNPNSPTPQRTAAGSSPTEESPEERARKAREAAARTGPNF